MVTVQLSKLDQGIFYVAVAARYKRSLVTLVTFSRAMQGEYQKTAARMLGLSGKAPHQ